MKKIAFVIPWYAAEIPGGAEMETREVTRHLHAAGIEVEILTTCIKEFASDWNKNFYPVGETEIFGVPVKRFPVKKRSRRSFDRVNKKLMQNIPVTAQEEQVFIHEMIRCPALSRYIATHKEAYTAFVFIPYLFSTTYFGVEACPEKAVLIPCFHDESYFYLRIFQAQYARVAGMIFNALPEKELTEHIYDISAVEKVVMGIGMETSIQAHPMVFRKKFGIEDPFILYAGRKDAGKNIPMLLQYFETFKRRVPSRLKLVLLGGGTITIPASIAADVLDLGFVETQDKYDAMGAAELLCQPSTNESFSLVMMESWLCSRPVLVHEHCAVTQNFVRQAQGGLFFANYLEFEECLRYLLQHSEIAAQMGENGKVYVQKNFDWTVIVAKYQAFFERMEERQL